MRPCVTSPAHNSASSARTWPSTRGTCQLAAQHWQSHHLAACRADYAHITRNGRLERENAILHRGICETTEIDLELQTVYHHLSEAEHSWNFTRQQVDLAREEVDTHNHANVHLENAIKKEDAELEERVEMIANLEQQLLELQEQAPPTPEDPDEIDVMSGVDED
jgi:chromosome segregation ATPase